MIPCRAIRLKNGVIRSLVKSSFIVSFESTIPIKTGRRALSFLEETTSSPRLINSDSKSIASIQKALPNIPIAEPVELPVEAGSLGPEIDTMNAQKEAELLAMQHVLGLKDASHEAVKIKPKQLEQLQRLKAAEPVFVCVDLEAYEFAHHKITEVGVSVLDSRHVIGTDPGPDGKEWLSKINTRHILVEEHKHLVNKKFVHGCPDKFNFGISEVVSLEHIHKTLTQLFDNPSPNSARASDQGSRSVILVGHGLSNDNEYLNKLEFVPNAKGNIIQNVDTQRFVGTKKQQVGLSKLMTGLGIEPENLHNAGNDAAYTLQALLLMTVQHTNNPGAYVKAVADAKVRVVSAKQKYKERRAAITARNLAQEKKAAANVALHRRTKFGQYTVEPALPATAQNNSFLASEIISRASPTGFQPQSDANVGSRTSRTHQQSGVPVSVGSELDGSISYGKITLDKPTAHKSSVQSSHEGNEGVSPYGRYSRPNRHNHPTRLHSSRTDHTTSISSSRKRKGSDMEPVDDGGKARLSNNARLHNQELDKAVATHPGISNTGSPFHITKEAETENDNDQPVFVPEAPAQSDASSVRNVNAETAEIPLEAAEHVEAAQSPIRFEIRRIATGKTKKSQQPARVRAAQSHLANDEAKQPETLSESPQFFR